MKKFSKNNRRDNDRPKNKVMTFKLPEVYVANRDKEVDAEQICDAFDFLEKNEVFGMLSTSVQITKALLFDDPEKKGFINVGFIKSVDVDKGSMDVTIYGGYVEKIENIDNAYGLYVNPRIIADREGDFVTFTNFDLTVCTTEE